MIISQGKSSVQCHSDGGGGGGSGAELHGVGGVYAIAHHTLITSSSAGQGGGGSPRVGKLAPPDELDSKQASLWSITTSQIQKTAP